MGFLIVLIVGFILMWLFIVLPQRRRQAAHAAMIQSLEPGDYIVTAGGLYGTITELGEDDLGLEIAPDLEVRVAKRAVGAVIPPDEIEDEDLDEGEEPEAALESARPDSGDPGPR